MFKWRGKRIVSQKFEKKKNAVNDLSPADVKQTSNINAFFHQLGITDKANSLYQNYTKFGGVKLFSFLVLFSPSTRVLMINKTCCKFFEFTYPLWPVIHQHNAVRNRTLEEINKTDTFLIFQYSDSLKFCIHAPFNTNC